METIDVGKLAKIKQEVRNAGNAADKTMSGSGSDIKSGILMERFRMESVMAAGGPITHGALLAGPKNFNPGLKG